MAVIDRLQVLYVADLSRNGLVCELPLGQDDGRFLGSDLQHRSSDICRRAERLN